jgi:hypothetical protein
VLLALAVLALEQRLEFFVGVRVGVGDGTGVGAEGGME